MLPHTQQHTADRHTLEIVLCWGTFAPPPPSLSLRLSSPFIFLFPTYSNSAPKSSTHLVTAVFPPAPAAAGMLPSAARSNLNTLFTGSQLSVTVTSTARPSSVT